MKILFIFFFCVPLLFAQKSTSPIPYGNNKSVGKYVNIRGCNLYYEIYGKGEPLLIIHGNGGSIENFKYQIPFFSQKYQVIVADSRAQGKSLDDQDSLSYEMMADDFASLLDHLKLDSAYVIGWSDGGINGLLLASRHPKKVKKLAVTGANLIPDAEIAIDAWVVQDVKKTMDSLSVLPQSLDVKRSLKLQNLLYFQPHISHEELAKIQCPTLVIGGDYDVILAKHTLEIAENIRKSYLWILPNSGHSTPIFYKDIFNQTVSRFFKQPYRIIEKADKLR
ncbi:alpha/beta fold hydrolase [Aquirufa sp. ROCK2-A2]